jgi:geranylgeranylglycerol-phosphate geranylgeranyltransferase
MADPAALIRLLRPVNSIMMGFAILVGAAIGDRGGLLNSATELMLAFVTGFTITGSSMAINDYYDRAIDAINEPQRPIPSGKVSPNEALLTTILLSIIGLLASWLTGFNHLVLALLTLSVSIIYNTVGKSTGFPGNLMVSICVSIPFIYGGMVTGGGVMGNSLYFALIAFLTNTGREVTKGIVDIKGDRVQGVKTVAILGGSSVAAWVSTLFYVSAIVLSIVPPMKGLVSPWYIPFVAFTDLGLLWVSYSLVKDPSRDNSRMLKNRLLFLMTSGMIGFLAGNLL